MVSVEGALILARFAVGGLFSLSLGPLGRLGGHGEAGGRAGMRMTNPGARAGCTGDGGRTWSSRALRAAFACLARSLVAAAFFFVMSFAS